MAGGFGVIDGLLWSLKEVKATYELQPDSLLAVWAVGFVCSH
jgi:hypothetical protein